MSSIEDLMPEPRLVERSSVELDAPPMDVWKHDRPFRRVGSAEAFARFEEADERAERAEKRRGGSDGGRHAAGA